MTPQGPGSQTPASDAQGRGLVLRLRHCAGGAARPGGGLQLLVCGLCSRSGKRPEVPNRPGMIVVRTFNVAGCFGGYVHRIATAEERVSVHRAAALARAAFLNAPQSGSPDG